MALINKRSKIYLNEPYKKHNVKRHLLIILFFSLILSSCGLIRKSLTKQTFNPIEYKTDKLSYSPIIWQNDSIGDSLVKKTSFCVPVKIKGIKQKVYMQFDLGSNISMFYENALLSLHSKLVSKFDTIKGKIYLSNVDIGINNEIKLIADKLYVKREFGYNEFDSTFPIIGTLGYDIIGKSILILDFKNNRYALTEKIPKKLSAKIEYIEGADLDKFPIILPFKLGEKKIRLMFDTGSSMFPILTGTKRLKKISKNNVIDSVGVINSWGSNIPVYRPKEYKDGIGDLFIGNIDLGKINVYGIDKMNSLTYFGKYFFGITGNIIFENAIIIIDRKDNKFGIIK